MTLARGAGQRSGDTVTTESMESFGNRFRQRGYDVIAWPGGQKSVDSFFGRGRTNAPKLVAGGPSCCHRARLERLAVILSPPPAAFALIALNIAWPSSRHDVG